jgi:hypothetical protein
VSVVWASADVQDVVAVDLPPDATVADAVARSGLLVHHGLDPATIGYAIFGRRTLAHASVADGDRVELTRALVADPKELRRRRAREAVTGHSTPAQQRRRRA